MSSFFQVPYRWIPRTFFENVWSVLEDLFWYGPRNMIRWAPVIWLDGDFDWASLADIMQYKITRMSNYFEKHGSYVDVKKDARQMRVCALLLKRLSEDKYSDNAAKAFGYGGKAWREEQDNVAKQDEELLFSIMRKHWRGWWD